MKKLLTIIFLSIITISCDSEDAPECFKTAGSTIQEELTLASFENILVNERVELIIKQGDEQKIVLESGKNLINDVDVQVVNNQLIVTDNNNCNFVRDYGLTKLYVTAPNIREIRSSTEQNISSDGVLNYPNLTIKSEDYLSNYLNVGDFYLEVENNSLRIVSNGISNFYISGKTEQLNITFAAGDSRFEGENLQATNVKISQKSTNDMLVYPIDKIEGDIYSLGDIIAFNTPSEINVTEHYKGKLIFN